jgi:uncharacterized protein YkwD
MRGEAVAAALLAAASLAPTPGPGCWDTAYRCHALTDLRGSELDQDRELQDRADEWADHMAATGVLRHSDAPWENVGTGTDWRQVYAAFMDSPHHRANMLDPDARQVGIGVARTSDGSRVYVVLQWR